MDRTATLNDVAECYRLFLERDVEDASTAVMQMAEVSNLWELINRFAVSTEAIRRKVNRASGFISDIYDPSQVDPSASDAQREDLLTDTLARWERCGRGFAYDQIFRDPRLFADRSGKWNREKRLEIAQEELQRMFIALHRNGITLPPHFSVLALGCEIAFLAAAIAHWHGRFLGLEISRSALEQGISVLEERSVTAGELISLRAFLESAPFDDWQRHDIFHSVMLLQHAPPPVALMLLHICLGRIKPGGHAYFQVPCQIYDYGFKTAEYLSAKSNSDAGEIHALPQSYVLQLLARHGFVPLEILPDQRIGPAGLSFTYLARKIR